MRNNTLIDMMVTIIIIPIIIHTIRVKGFMVIHARDATPGLRVTKVIGADSYGNEKSTASILEEVMVTSQSPMSAV